MIRTWAADVSPLMKDQVYQQYYEKVPQFRKEKADKIRFLKDKVQSIGAWTLYMQMCSAYGLSEGTVFNLSHTDSYVLCSVADGEGSSVKVGCDIEGIKELRMDIAKRFFCRNEAKYIEKRETEAERIDAFYRYWVLKESFMKATRLGMGLDMQSFEIEMSKENQPVLIEQPGDVKEQYYYEEYRVDAIPAKIAVCSTSNIFDKIKVYTLLD